MWDRSRLDRILQEQVDTGFVPGVNALVTLKGEEIYYGQAGVKSYETGEPMNRDTIVRLFSMSKPITAVAVMKLVEEGRLSLSDKLSDYLPCFADMEVMVNDTESRKAVKPITIWDLLHMTSGIPYPDSWHEPGRRMGEVFYGLIHRREQGEVVTTLDYMKEIAKVPLCYEPGSKWMYGLSADVLGAVIEQVTGLRYDVYLRKNIWEPLGMKDTGFFVPTDKRDRFASAYEWNEKDEPVLFTRSYLGEYYGEDVAFLSGGAGMVSTADDYSRFTQMLSNKGSYRGVQVLKPETIAYMAKDDLSKAQKVDFQWESLKGYGYGCLVRTLSDPRAAGTLAPVGEFGWDGWMGCYMQADPVNDLAIVYLIQRCGAGTSAGAVSFRNQVYEMLKEEL